MKIPSSLKFTGKDPSIVGFEKQKLLNALREKLTEKITEQETIMGKVPNILVGSYNYPDVNTGFLATNNFKDEDNPKDWAQKNISIKDIILKRQTLTNSRFKTNIKIKRFSDKIKEVSLSQNPVDAEVFLEGTTKKEFSFSNDLLPHGPVGTLKKIDVLENPKVPFHLQRAESDTDLKAGEAINILFSKGLDEHYLTKVVSAGNLGLKTQRKIVPTKWTITLVDDTLGKKIIKETRYFNDHELAFFEGSYLGNYYFALIFPGPWSFELFEVYVGGIKNSSDYAYASDYESPFGRVKYAENTSGGYYASRLGVLEYLAKKKLRGKVLLFRFITEEYWAPLGVWVVREATRNAFKGVPSTFFEDKEQLLNYAFLSALKRFKINVREMYRQSVLLKDVKQQKTLT